MSSPPSPRANAAPLAEVAEHDAIGEIASVYGSLRESLGVPLVNLVFRHMATVPDCLPWAWGCLAPIYRGSVLHTAAAEMVGMVAREMSSEFRFPDLLPRELVRDTLSIYIRANPINMIGLHLLMRGLEGAAAGESPGPFFLPPMIGKAMPIVPLPQLSDETVVRLRGLASLVSGEEGPVIHSVFRHFANAPVVLDHIEAVLRPLAKSGSLTELSAKLTTEGRHIAARLAVVPASAPTAETRDTIQRLGALLPSDSAKMTVLALVLQGTL